MFEGFPLVPAQASTYARGVDILYFSLVGFSVFFTVLISLLILYFAIRYRARTPGELAAPTSVGLHVEVLWMVAPFVTAISLLVWGVTLFMDLQRPPADALEMTVIGRQWMWKVQHPSGHREINELHVPVGQAVRLVMASEDVIHSFFVPAFRIKQDVLPGRFTTTWFEATEVGRYHLFCAEYCGTDHAQMGGWVIVMEPAAYQRWLSAGALPESPEAAGARVFAEQECGSCHTGEPDARGPSLAGLLGQVVTFADGSSVVADEHYLRESILNPRARIVAGYRPLMPPFRGRISEEGLVDLIAFLTSLPSEVAPERSER